MWSRTQKYNRKAKGIELNPVENRITNYLIKMKEGNSNDDERLTINERLSEYVKK
jgi:hypothetical protein